MSAATWISRVVAGSLVGVGTIFLFLQSPVDGWLPLLVGSIGASIAIPGLSVVIGSSHYRIWATRRKGRSASAIVYILIEALRGFPVVAATSFVGFALSYAARVAP